MRHLPLSCLLFTGCAATIDTLPGDTVGNTSEGVTSIDGHDSSTPGSTTTESIDADMDGFDADEDCDDTNPAIHPEATEFCNDGVDNNCDGQIDEGCPQPLSNATASLLGDRRGDRAGASVASAGDVNGDGQEDLIVGAREYESFNLQIGRAYVVFGPIPEEARALSDLPGVTIEGSQFGAGTGKVVAGLGDLNGDGLDEVMVTSDVADTDDWENTGLLHIFDGATLSRGDDQITVDAALGTVQGRSNYNWLGVGVTATNDMNGDGVRDVWVGASGDRAGALAAGAVFLLSGSDLMGETASGALDSAILEVIGTEEGAYLGSSLGVPGDVDGDGIDDFTLGIPLSAGRGDLSGRVTLFQGDTTGRMTTEDAWVIWTGDAGDRLGCDVSAAGDQNDDGYADLWVGADRVDVSNADAGSAMLIYGGPELDDTSGAIDRVWDARLLGDVAGQGLGHTLDGSRDVDGDGRNDLVLGTPLAGTNIEGGVVLVVGPVEGTADIGDRARSVWSGVNPEDRAGWQAQLGGDLLGTGQQTVVVSAWESDRSGQDAGEVYILGL
jgi:hypothetical protein